MFLGSRERPVRKAGSFNVISEQIVWTMWDPQNLRTLVGFHGL
jgi:hypothetical protein